MTPEQIREFASETQQTEHALCDAVRWMAPLFITHLREVSPDNLRQLKADLARFDSHKLAWRREIA